MTESCPITNPQRDIMLEHLSAYRSLRKDIPLAVRVMNGYIFTPLAIDWTCDMGVLIHKVYI